MAKPINHSMWVLFTKGGVRNKGLANMSRWFDTRKEARKWKNKSILDYCEPVKFCKDY